MYAVPIWVDELEKKYTGDMLTKVQRYVTLRIVSGYRTVSTSAALVVGSLPPVDLLAVETKGALLKYGRKNANDGTE